jgi:hypothetical protein
MALEVLVPEVPVHEPPLVLVIVHEVTSVVLQVTVEVVPFWTSSGLTEKFSAGDEHRSAD